MTPPLDLIPAPHDDGTLLRLVLEWVPAGVAMFDRDMRYLAVSRSFRDQYGLGGQDVLGRSHYDIFPDLPERWRTVHRRCLAGDTRSADDDSFVRADGHVEFLSWSCRPWYDHRGEIGGILLFTRDATAEVLRRKAACRMADAVAHAAFGIAIIDARDNRINEANPAYAGLLGSTPRDLIGVPLLETYPPDQRGMAAEQLARADREGYAQYEAPRQRRDGACFPASMLLSGTRADMGAIPYRVCTVLDATERERTLAALHESEARLRFTTEATGIGTWEVDIATGKATRSPRHAAIFGVDPADAWTQDAFLDQVLPEDREQAERSRRAGLAAQAEWQFTCRIRRANDGAVRWIEVRGAPMPGPSGQVRRYVGIVSDVTDRKQAEARHARAAEELEHRVAERTRALADANARLTTEIAERREAEAALVQAQRLEAIGQIVGGVGHSFNNLLAAIVGSLDLAMASPDLAEVPRRHLRRALRAAAHGGVLTEQLLAYARQQVLETGPVAVNQAVAAALGAIAAEREGLVIAPALAADLWPAHGAASQLRTIVQELVGNARAAMPAGGEVRVRTRNLPAGADTLPPELPAGDYVQLTVEDDGPGMPPDVLARASEPFFTTRPVGQGNGLGLAQVDGIARQFGGTLRLRSMPGAGTAVDVLLPRASCQSLP